MANLSRPEPDQNLPRSRSKKLVKWGSGLFAAFLAFAPPGTMILLALLFWQFFGDNWLPGLVVLILAIATTAFLLIRRRKPKS